jgi:uncharacterized DUF497 family protein
MSICFEWDAVKASTNLRKHGVSFELALHVFTDPLAFSQQDRIEGGEQRWQTLGMVDGVLLLLVAHTVEDQADGEVIRIISARRATRNERYGYEQANS